VQIGSLIAYIKGKLADFLEFTVRIAQGVQRFLHLPEDAPYVRALQGMASAARESEEASLGLLAAEEARLARAKQAVEFAKQAAEATYEEVAAEQEFNRTKEEQDRLMRQGLELKEAEARLLKEQEERRQQLVSDLQTQVRQSLLTAAEQGIVAVQALRDAWIKEFGGISDVAEQMFNAIEAKAREALSQERAEELAQGYRDALEQGLERIDFAYIGVEDETGKLEAQRSVIEGIRDAVRKRLAFTENTREEEDALRKLLLEIEAILDRINKKEEKSSKEDNKNAEERLRNLQATLSLIRQAVDGALQLAQAFGLVNDETAKVIRSLEQIGEGAATLALGLSTGNVGGIVSGALGVIGGVAGLFGGGESPEEKRRRETLAKNTEAIEKLTREIGNFGANVTGAEFATLQRLLTNANQARLNEIGNARGIFGTGLANIHFRDNVISNLAALGLSMEDLERIAKELGITFADDVPTAQELLQVMEAMAQTELTRFAQDYTSQLAALRAEFELFDITDPLEQLQKLRQLASAQGATAFAPVFQGLDLNREADRAAAERRLQDLFRQLQQGTLSPEQLGGLTPEQFLQLLLEADKLLKAAGEGGLAGGTTQDVRQQVSITELQANQLLAYQSTLVFRAEERNQLLGNILNTLQTGLALTPPEIGTTTGGTVVRVDVSVGPNQFDVSTDDPTSVDQIAEDLAQAIGARLQEQDVLLGVRR
jgi:hypothetical protein